MTMLDTPLRETTTPNAIDRRQEFGKKTGKKRGTVDNERGRESAGKEEGQKERGRERRRVSSHRGTSGLISQQCDLFALYSHKEPTLLCHYVTKKGVIGQ